MSRRLRWLLVLVVSALALGGTGIVGFAAWNAYQARAQAESVAPIAASADWATGPRVVFRNTAAGEGYGLVASVPLDELPSLQGEADAPGSGRASAAPADPSADAPRALGPVACDRVAVDADGFSCLRSERGITPTYTAAVYSWEGHQTGQWPLPGVPSRSRFSPDGSLVATTAFVTGHAYAAVGFSTQTNIRTVQGKDVAGDLEDWTLLLDGKRSAPVDRNYWGITFVDNHTFYATVGMTTRGITYLVRGDLRSKTFTSVAKGVECPSLSPDGTRIAFKKVTEGSGASVHWTPAVLDLASGKVTVLRGETHSVDDQILWLDERTLAYAVPNQTPGDSDVWALDVGSVSDRPSGNSVPSLYLRHAASPNVVRP